MTGTSRAAHPGLLARSHLPSGAVPPSGAVTVAAREHPRLRQFSPARAARRQCVNSTARAAGATVRLDHVTFAHRPGQPVLDEADLQVRAGEFLCLTGPSGGGKSTLLSLLVRLAEPDSGRITIGGTDIARIPLRRLRDLVTLVPQDPWLHTGTIADNIRYGRPDATSGQVLDAARRAGVTAFTAGLPGGHDTVVGEHGRQLSGGQQRRVAVARALLREAPVLLLDEPTAGLDTVTEERLIGDLLGGLRGSTLILVTHQPRLQTLADRVARLDHGRITRPLIGWRSAPAVLALHLVLDVLFGDLGAPVDVPCVHHHADAPASDREYRPEEPVHVRDRPDHHQERVDQHIDKNVAAEVAPLLQLGDRFVAGTLIVCVVDHGGPSP